MKVYGELEKAQAEQLAADPTGAGLVQGRFWQRTDTKEYKFYDGTNVVRVHDDKGEGTVTLGEIATPGNPSAGESKLYFKSDGLLYRLNSSGDEELVGGSGSGSGGINYILNPDVESDLDGWNVYDDSSAGDPSVPVDGTGTDSSNPTLSLETTASRVIRGTQSASLAAVQGKGVSYDFAIDNSDKDKRLYVSLEYSNTQTRPSFEWGVFIYDIDNGVLLGAIDTDDDGLLPYKERLDLSDSGAAKVTGSFEATDSSNYRLIIHRTEVGLGSTGLIFDNVRVGPDVVVPGAILEKAQPFSPVFPAGVTLGNGSTEGEYWREGQFMVGYARLQLGTTSAITGSVTLQVPAGKSIDTNVVLTSAGTTATLGECQLVDSGTASHGGQVGYLNSTTLLLNTYQVSGTDVVKSSLSATIPFTWSGASGDFIHVNFKIPIDGWSAGASLSTTEANLLTAQVQASMNVTVAGTTAKATFNTINVDTLNIVDSTADDITIPRTGRYLLSLIGLTDSISWNSPGDNFNVVYRINGGSWVVVAADRASVVHTGRLDASGSVILDLAKNDTLEIGQISSDSTISAITMSLAELPDFSTFSVWGEFANYAVQLGTDFLQTTSDTWQTMTGMQLDLPAGGYLVGYGVSPTSEFISGTALPRVNFRVYNSTDAAEVPRTKSVAYNAQMTASTQAFVHDLGRVAYVFLSEGKTLDLQLRSNADGTTHRTAIRPSNITGSLTDPDVDQVFWAMKVK
jgi:hypothetical protein